MAQLTCGNNFSINSDRSVPFMYLPLGKGAVDLIKIQFGLWWRTMMMMVMGAPPDPPPNLRGSPWPCTGPLSRVLYIEGESGGKDFNFAFVADCE